MVVVALYDVVQNVRVQDRLENRPDCRTGETTVGDEHTQREREKKSTIKFDDASIHESQLPEKHIDLHLPGFYFGEQF